MQTFGELCLFIFIALQLLDEHFYIYKLFTLELKEMYDLYDEFDEEDEENHSEDINHNHIWSLPSEIFPNEFKGTSNEVSSMDNVKLLTISETPSNAENTDFKDSVIEASTYDFISNLENEVEAAVNPKVIDIENYIDLEKNQQETHLEDETHLEELSNNNKGESKMNDTLSMDDWNIDTPAFTLFSHHDEHIGDYIMGEQTWYCEIYGKNERHIHVLDLTDKLWLDLSNHPDLSIHLHEIVKIRVNRTSEKIEVLSLEYLDIEEENHEYTDVFVKFEHNSGDYFLEEHELTLKTSD